MRTVFLSLLLMGSAVLSAQNVLDSIQLYEYPVKQGVIYKYEYDCNSSTICAPSLSIVSVVTPNDSVFHFEDGKVAGVFTLDGFYTVTIRNAKEEFITYSNLKSSSLKKGDLVIKGSYLGTAAQSDEAYTEDRKQVDILILRKIKQLSYRKAIEYIRYNMSSGGKSLGNTFLRTK